MRLTRVIQGGGRHFHYPKNVWSPAGGWWNEAPPNWERNTVLAFAGVFLGAAAVFSVSSAKERRPVPPIATAPSQLWCKHAEADDPSIAPYKEDDMR